jgi:membrane-bound lytic murein transglycosylase A
LVAACIAAGGNSCAPIELTTRQSRSAAAIDLLAERMCDLGEEQREGRDVERPLCRRGDMTRRSGMVTAARRSGDARTQRSVAADRRTRLVASLAGAILCAAAVTANAADAEDPLKLADSQLEPLQWTELAGWRTDDHLAAFAAYQRSCQAMRRMRSEDRGRIRGALWNVCRDADGLRPQDSQAARAFFERNFLPVRIARLGEAAGLLTGYFEPVVQGSRMPNPEFHVPVYRRPRDLLAAGHKPGAKAFPNKGARIGRLNEKKELVPYYDRGAIEAGALDGQGLEICWLKDPLDLFAIQLEGSGRVILEDGTPLRVNYDAHNGYPFSSISRVLVERSLVPRGETSAQRIRAWMAAHPEEAAKVRAVNRSYVFFRITGLTNDGEPVGAQGVPLTPGRSIAVDRRHEYGTPFFIEADLPVEGAKPASLFRRLMVAQDTGSAIVGPARADLYWGSGDDAGRIANRIRHSGKFVMLVPRELDMVEAGRHMPLPAPKPKIPAVEVAALEKGKVIGKGKALDKPKTPAVEPATVGRGKATESKTLDKSKVLDKSKLDAAGSGEDRRAATRPGRGGAVRAAAPAPDCGRRPAPAACARAAPKPAGTAAGKPAGMAASVSSSRARRAN